MREGGKQFYRYKRNWKVLGLGSLLDHAENAEYNSSFCIKLARRYHYLAKLMPLSWFQRARASIVLYPSSHATSGELRNQFLFPFPFSLGFPKFCGYTRVSQNYAPPVRSVQVCTTKRIRRTEWGKGSVEIVGSKSSGNIHSYGKPIVATDLRRTTNQEVVEPHAFHRGF